MCVWTKKRGSMNAVVLMATSCPKALHGKGERWIAAQQFAGPRLGTFMTSSIKTVQPLETF